MSQKWIESSAQLCTAVVLDALDSAGRRNQSPRIAMPSRTVNETVVGVAKTLLWVDFAHDDPKTYELELKAIDSVQPNEVIVCATGVSVRSGIWGELLTTAATANGAVGVLTDGAVRDTARMTEMRFPVYAHGLSPYDSYNRQKVVAYDVPVEIGGVLISPGDIIVVDGDGAAVVPSEIQEDVLTSSLEKVNSEDAFRDAVKGGMPLHQAYEKFQIL